MFNTELSIQQLKSLLPDYLEAPSLPECGLLDYCQFYQLDKIPNLEAHYLGTLNCYGTDLSVQRFIPSGKKKGVVILVHGYLEHLALQQPLISYLISNGYEVLGYDLPGHGLSNGPEYWIDSFTRYGCQFGELLQRLKHQLGYAPFVLGHSTGAAVIMAHQMMFSDSSPDFKARILLAPLIRPSRYWLIKSQYNLLRYFLNRVPRRFSVNSHDTEYLNFILEDPLQNKFIPIDWIRAMLVWNKRVERSSLLTGPVEVIQGTDDGTVNWQYNLSVLEQLYWQPKIKLIDGAKHQLVNESSHYQTQVMQSVGQALVQYR